MGEYINMERNIFDYTKLSELTKRRIRRFSTTKKEDAPDSLLLILLGNMNERLNTMFYLMNNNIYDGVYPLQRTFLKCLLLISQC